MSAFTATNSESGAYVNAIAEQLRGYDETCRRREEKLAELWGAEPPYEEQAEDRARWPWSYLLYTWLGDVMYKASREELTQEGLPRPMQGCRAYNTGTLLSRELQRQRNVEHGWDALCGTAVVRYTGVGRAARQRLPRRVLRALARMTGWGGSDGVTVADSGLRVGATGVLRWCGKVQQYDAGGQRYAGVEWEADAVAAALEGAAVVPDGCVCAWHDGTVCGEHLFETSDGRATATCERVEDVTIIVPGRPARDGESAADDGLPPAVHTRPRGMSATRAIFATLWGPMNRVIPVRVMRDACTILVPLLLQYYIEYLEKVAAETATAAAEDGDSAGVHDKTRVWLKGIAIVAVYFVFIEVQAVTQSYYWFATLRCACMFRAALSGVIFEKCLTISGKYLAHPRVNTGYIVNLLGTDVATVEEFTMWFWASIGSAAQLIAGVTLLYHMMGWPAFLGFGVMFPAVLLQSMVARKTFDMFAEKSAITDARLKATNEFLSGIRVVKFMSWDPSFIVKINEIREVEIQKIKRIQLYLTLLSFLSAAIPNLVLAVVLLCYALAGNTLKASVVFPAIALEGIIEMPFLCVPMIASAFTHFFVSMRRVSRFVECDDNERAVVDMADDFAAEHRAMVTEGRKEAYEEARRAFVGMYAARLKNATLSAFVAEPLPAMDSAAHRKREDEKKKSSKSGKKKDGDEDEDQLYELRVKTLLEDVDLRIPRGKLTVVLGPTGCGKSTLLDSLIGALAVTRGRVACSRCVAYVPQQPWIMSATLRDNVVFFGAADDAAFERAVASSQLAADLALLAAGAATEIGEKGINLSGGQKARVSLARAVYADRDVYVLDDPLSALDAHVGERVMRECVCGALAHKTRVLATHQVHVARDADYVVVLSAGGVVFQGDAAAYSVYCDINAELPLNTAVRQAAVEEPDDVIDEGSAKARGRAAAADVEESDGDGAATVSVCTAVSRKASRSDVGGVDVAAKLIEDEEMAVGAVTRDVYVSYMKACCRMRVWWILAALYIGTELLIVSSRVWLSFWTAKRFSGVSDATYLYVYLVLVMTGIVAHPIRRCCTYPVLRRGCRVIHDELLRSVSSGTMAFFDTTPLGRIVNRFSKDLNLLDDRQQENLVAVLDLTCNLVSYLCVVLVTELLAIVPMVPCAYLYYRLSLFFTAANRAIRRRANVSNAPVLALLTTLLAGRWTIEAYGCAKEMIRCFCSHGPCLLLLFSSRDGAAVAGGARGHARERHCHLRCLLRRCLHQHHEWCDGSFAGGSHLAEHHVGHSDQLHALPGRFHGSRVGGEHERNGEHRLLHRQHRPREHAEGHCGRRGRTRRADPPPHGPRRGGDRGGRRRCGGPQPAVARVGRRCVADGGACGARCGGVARAGARGHAVPAGAAARAARRELRGAARAEGGRCGPHGQREVDAAACAAAACGGVRRVHARVRARRARLRRA
ncbi:putative mitochondrial multidrug resistance protein E [Leptomonas pyrrhocoris]|uniref:Putative mitochondrial multidrug resistance protein E n=1 Tax=Leptomonas pyrrhocoris TaxID=157538 RepID=A0A0N0DUG9_LEPPY|nr:putative mitochondrial multidrug resistance protein E [Leptomonas pyrrhocoris]KPA78918.1 putative mitochondrial multidrug resistance protein E [Leptomonas pyrrhocoris]|eukprot:XP_015657357.1 putative mitochondrial multidrug resistance protein E [Leptomonas pyrrhocoris]